jgi:hypothetical protein
MLLLPNAVTTATYRRETTFFFDDDTSASEFKTIKKLTSFPDKGDVCRITLREWQEMNPSIVRITFSDTPVLVDNTPDEIARFKVANLSR